MVGKRLKKLREEKNLNQEEFAKILNISRSSIGMYESNKREPSDELKKQFADFFNCTIDYLMGTSDVRKPFIVPPAKKSGVVDELFNKYYSELQKEFQQAGLVIDIDGLTEEDIEEIKEFVRFRKERRKKN